MCIRDRRYKLVVVVVIEGTIFSSCSYHFQDGLVFFGGSWSCRRNSKYIKKCWFIKKIQVRVYRQLRPWSSKVISVQSTSDKMFLFWLAKRNSISWKWIWAAAAVQNVLQQLARIITFPRFCCSLLAANKCSICPGAQKKKLRLLYTFFCPHSICEIMLNTVSYTHLTLPTNREV